MAYTVWPTMHSLHGKRFGITPEGWPTGENGGYMERVTAFTSASTGTLVPAAGLNTFKVTTSGSTTTGGAFLLDYPRPGVRVTLVNIASASTQNLTITTTSYIIGGFNSVMGSSVSYAGLSSAGQAYQTITMTQPGNVVNLIGVSTTYYMVTGLSGFTTSTASAILS